MIHDWIWFPPWNRPIIDHSEISTCNRVVHHVEKLWERTCSRGIFLHNIGVNKKRPNLNNVQCIIYIYRQIRIRKTLKTKPIACASKRNTRKFWCELHKSSSFYTYNQPFSSWLMCIVEQGAENSPLPPFTRNEIRLTNDSQYIRYIHVCFVLENFYYKTEYVYTMSIVGHPSPVELPAPQLSRSHL